MMWPALAKSQSLRYADAVRVKGAITLAYDTRNASHGSWYETRNIITHKLAAFLLCWANGPATKTKPN
ncbi:hypothetical protein E2C01_086383 [Portunus trituberculatus]|uniref:Uncharacterized protein n=1 Tax=Portunus trituberculatus TaxID=210409 RepID=A0A5B7JG70_PORTR|nr:hypothetical protein [Portunus trituberculatus]